MRTVKNKRNKRRTYKGGILEHNKNSCGKTPIDAYQKLYDEVDTQKYGRGFNTYNSGGCDLFIWKKKSKTKKPHIHVYGFSNGQYQYSITDLNFSNQSVSLPADNKEGYIHVLDEMFDRLTNGGHIHKSTLFDSPTKTIKRSLVERPNKPGRQSSVFSYSNIKGLSKKLGPIMGRESSIQPEGSLITEKRQPEGSLITE